MKNYLSLILGCTLFIAGQIIVWFQSSAIFMWPKTKDYILWIAIICGISASLCFIKGTELVTSFYDGQLWPSRIITNVLGTITFTILTYFLLNQGINLKTGICIILSFLIIFIQLFWK